MAEFELDLPPEFLTASREDWQAAVERALKGASFERLRSHTYDGLVIEPLYGRERDAPALKARQAGLPWRVVQRVDHPESGEANALLLQDLEGGATGIELVFSSSARARGCGLSADNVERLDKVLDGVLLDLAEFRIDAGYETTAALALFLALAERRGVAPSALKLVGTSDYVGKLALTGVLRNPPSVLRPRLGDLGHFARGHGLDMPVVHCDGRVWHDGGASKAQELAYVFATAIHYLRDLDACGIAAEDLAGMIGFTLAADTDQVGTIAKARAARRMWARLLEASNLPQRPMHLHMQTSWRMMSRRDPWVNLLRTTIASFSAGIGGADSVTALPFSSALGLPDAFARRIARNTQSILLEESNLHRVCDPSAGSGAIEARTSDLAEAAWRLMQDIERGGGIVEALRSGKAQGAIGEVRDARARDIATRRYRITGTSAFPDIHEKPVSVLAARPDDVSEAGQHVELRAPGKGELMRALLDAARKGASLADILVSRKRGEAVTAEAILPHRDAEPFEALRDAADEAKVRPAVFLATLGRLSEFTARATWAKNFFEVGGIEAQGSEQYDDIAAAVAAWKAAGSPLVCLCSSDRTYETLAEEAVKAFREAGAGKVYMAGRPGESERRKALSNAGVETFLYEGCDALALLRAAHEHLGLGPAASRKDA
ncbi:methylmalonyl-CoA mutase [Stappia sp. GBMRC 2046]|uniref:methylmalonyl-CoA mutase n=1 Tax=Stappia sediminis TaxID=2692190 RepID=A0A7X3S8F1_9HYPH|nr:methylmalonyl-CoA mutase family protein [Stappia sediminis]MXN65762.1 methylmalonyl-CoA mutase [Stappia sediminis]